MWLGVLGAELDPHRVSLEAWERFVDGRASGAIDAQGRDVSVAERREVGPRTVQADGQWLRWVFNWATRWRLGTGAFLMRENPVRGYEAPRERNPRRPTATEDRYEAVRAVSDRVGMETRWGRPSIRLDGSSIFDAGGCDGESAPVARRSGAFLT
jgi:hypothetical protein